MDRLSKRFPAGTDRWKAIAGIKRDDRHGSHFMSWQDIDGALVVSYFTPSATTVEHSPGTPCSPACVHDYEVTR